MSTTIKKTLLASSIALAVGPLSAQAGLVIDVLGPYDWSSNSANFTLLASTGGVVDHGSNNDTNFSWDGDAYNDSSDYAGPGGASNVMLSSTTPLFGHTWTAHDIQMFLPGSYSFDTTLGSGVTESGLWGADESGVLNVSVGNGQLGMHMLFDWYTIANMDIFVLFSGNSVFGSGLLFSTQTATPSGWKCGFSHAGTIVENCLWDGYVNSGSPSQNQIWMLASVDGNGDGIMGVPMPVGGPFQGFSANFNVNLTPTAVPAAVPVPAAAWLFGSGLIALIGGARRKRT